MNGRLMILLLISAAINAICVGFQLGKAEQQESTRCQLPEVVKLEIIKH